MTKTSISDFPERPANNSSLTSRKLVCGIGLNDAPYMTNLRTNGKQLICPFYRTWKGMLVRCYDKKFHTRQPRYKGCSVCEEWLSFMTFRAWMVEQDWEGKCLDKDILILGNKHYSPETCLFVPSHVNTLLSDCAARRGKYPQGVCKIGNAFMARVSRYGERGMLGCFSTPEEAEAAYLKAKATHVIEVAETEAEPLKSALLRQAEAI